MTDALRKAKAAEKKASAALDAAIRSVSIGWWRRVQRAKWAYRDAVRLTERAKEGTR